MATVENIDPNILENVTGTGFQTKAHRGMLTPDYNAVVQYNFTDTGWFKLHAPTVSRAATEENPNIAAT